jgi:transposase
MSGMKTNIKYNDKTKEELLQLINTLTENIQNKDSQINSQAKQIQVLEEYILAQKHRQFSIKSEKFTPDQISLFDEAQLPKNPEKIVFAEEEIQVASYTRKKNCGRKALPKELPRVQHIYDLNEDEKSCNCGCPLTYISDEKSEQLEIIPPKVYVIEYIRKKYACKACQEMVKTAKMPPLPIPRSIAASGLLSHVLVSKFQDHLPLFRQEQILKRVGVDIPRATLSLWTIKCAQLFNPLLKLIHDNIVTYDIAYADETTIQVIKEPNKSISSKKYMWLFSGGPPEKFAFYYQYHPSRSHDVPLSFFEDFKGYLHCDGFTAYDSLANTNKNIILVGCLYHSRRKFVEILKITKNNDGVAYEVVKQIAEVAKIEAEIKDKSFTEKYDIRLNIIKPLLDSLQDYLMSVLPSIPPKSLLGKAVSYTLNQWSKLTNHLKDGRLENNNNLSERAIKPFVIGRKGWLFANSVEGAHAAARIFSLIETCKYHEIEPYYYFRYILNELPKCTTLAEFEALLPYNIDKKLLVTD